MRTQIEEGDIYIRVRTINAKSENQFVSNYQKYIRILVAYGQVMMQLLADSNLSCLSTRTVIDHR